MAQEMICGRCGRRETVETTETAAICPACGGTLLWAAPAARTSTEGPSPLLFRIVVSYASVVTLACAYLMYLLLTRPPSLDLPDLAPPVQTGNRVTTLQYLPPEKRLPSEQQQGVVSRSQDTAERLGDAERRHERRQLHAFHQVGLRTALRGVDAHALECIAKR